MSNKATKYIKNSKYLKKMYEIELVCDIDEQEFEYLNISKPAKKLNNRISKLRA